ncbi:ferritin family protein [bacterium]|nr:ferritin family protein [bacterium]
MEFKSIDDIVQYAIDKEIEAAEFYEEASGNIKLVGAKKVLQEYAAEERKHEQILKDLKENKTKISQYKFEKIQDVKRSDFLVERVYRPDMDYVELMRLAMKKEEKASLLYTTLSQSTDNTEHAKFFTMLAQEEMKHKNSLEKLYDDHMAQLGD